MRGMFFHTGVNCFWRMGHELLQQLRKLAFACARAQCIKAGKILLWSLGPTEKWEHEEKHALVQGHIGELSSNLSFLQDRYGKSSLFTHGWHHTNTIRFGTFSWCWKAREVRGKKLS